MIRCRSLCICLTLASASLVCSSIALASGGGGHGGASHGKPKAGGHGAAAGGHGSAKASEHGAKAGGHGAKKSAHGEAKSAHGASHGAAASGHGAAAEKPAAPTPSDYEQLLAIITSKERRHDPRTYTEQELGDFKVTHPGPDDGEHLVKVKFRIYGVISETDQPQWEKALEGRQQRMRDAVLSVVHKTPFDELNDPSLDAVKSELIVSINRVLEASLLRDVAFSTFSIDRN